MSQAGRNYCQYVLLLIYATLLLTSDALLVRAADRSVTSDSALSVPVPVRQQSAFTHPNSGSTAIGGRGRSSMMSSKAAAESSSASCPPPPRQQAFGRYVIDSSQIFYRSPSNLSTAIVNLRPIVPGHVLILSTRVAPLLKDLTDDEYCDLWQTVRKVQDMLDKKYGSSNSPCSFNVAVQDGRSAGQSVPHVHVHILPRHDGDFERNDEVYDELEAWAPRAEDGAAKKEMGRGLDVLDDPDRMDRTMEQMKAEADAYRELMNEVE
mmetsp:Transcript_17496/g.37954  ORF Transcript_17496/g.37954 Transcript_17496/m.37954 type:complete len:265 (+) Transcript_17496:71-865(+)|eukprot:CAMPEP_0178721710 /NCGR_PEP_ID=MMETSP0699-20121125/24520_1 /TAXON_ID=265572 /ORGANISM="Extubocellulus spinifer, Strain CCMP396" /LENGTH=264 /DNA_ID=CAMNT_0020372465 /DNA_START=86 /DNA_END=880 /DNA_ORIENTATION=-